MIRNVDVLDESILFLEKKIIGTFEYFIEVNVSVVT